MNTNNVFNLIIVLLLFILLWMVLDTSYFTNTSEDKLLECYVIHLDRSTDRLSNINNIKIKTNFMINIVNAVDGLQLDVKKLVNTGIVNPDYYKKHQNPSIYGCYLSHYNLIEMLLNKYENNELKTEYSIIMEDDVVILDSQFDNSVKDIITKINKLNIEIEKISPTAFVVMHSVKDTKGGMIKKKGHKF